MRTLTQTVRLALAASAVVAGSIAVAAPANAVATPPEACGNNYHEIDHKDLGSGVIHLLYNGSTDCVVTSKTSHTNEKTHVIAGIMFNDGSDMHRDDGNYQYYAGPVRLYAPGKCINWGGFVQTTTGLEAWNSPLPTKQDPRPAQAHCG